MAKTKPKAKSDNKAVLSPPQTTAAAGGNALLSQRKYAAHRKDHGLPGGSLQGVQRAVTAGRITLEADGRIDPYKADLQWQQNTDDGKRSSDGTGGMVQEAGAVNQADAPTAAPAAAPVTMQPSPFQTARTSNEQAKADLAMLKLRRERGELVEVSVAKLAMDEMVSAARTKLLAIPSKIRSQMPHITTADVKAIDGLIRDALSDLATGDAKRAN